MLRHNMAAISEIGHFRTRSALFVICSVILGLSTHSSIREGQGKKWTPRVPKMADEGKRWRSECYSQGERTLQILRPNQVCFSTVKFELFIEFCGIHKNYVVIFNLILFDLSFVYRCARFIKKAHLICSPIASQTAVLCSYSGGCKLQVAGCRCRLQVQVAGCRLQVAGCRLQVAVVGCRLQVAGCGLQDNYKFKKQLL